jgi:radical SAM superfamily enzyme YgiQ (UPF0313 family)
VKLLLINLPREGEALDYTTRDYLLTDFSKYPPLGLMAVATGIDRTRHEVVLHDANVKNLSIEETVAQIKSRAPDVLGMSVVTRRLYAMHDIARRIKAELPGTRIVAGGPHINYWPRETMELGSVDYCLPGYAENTFPQLVDAIAGGEDAARLATVPGLHYRSGGEIRANPDERVVTKTLDHLPFPDRTLLDLDDYYTAVDRARMTTTFSSRGCPFRCIFCDVQEKAYLYRTAEKMADEFEVLIGSGIKEIHIFDDVFNIRRQRVLDLCDAIIRRKLRVRWSIRARVNPWDDETLAKLREAGCRRIHVGVESLDPTTLAYMNKKQSYEDIVAFFQSCQRLDIETLAYFIIGFPTESREYRERLYEEVMKINPTYAFFNILFPLPKTQYYQSLLDDGTYDEDHWAEFFKAPTAYYEVPLPRSPAVQKELEDLADRFHRKFCYRLGFLFKEFWHSLTYPKMLLLKIRLAFVLARETIFWRRSPRKLTYLGSDATRAVHGANG